MNEDSNGDIVPIVVDLGTARKKEVNESFLAAFGFAIKKILERMFGVSKVPISVKGSPAEVRSFAKTLSREKRYIDAYSKFGLDNPRTYKSKFRLDQAVSQFERRTGLKWPFNN